MGALHYYGLQYIPSLKGVLDSLGTVAAPKPLTSNAAQESSPQKIHYEVSWQGDSRLVWGSV